MQGLRGEPPIPYVNISVCICVYSWVCISVSLGGWGCSCEIFEGVCLHGSAAEMGIWFEEKAFSSSLCTNHSVALRLQGTGWIPQLGEMSQSRSRSRVGEFQWACVLGKMAFKGTRAWAVIPAYPPEPGISPGPCCPTSSLLSGLAGVVV